MSTQIDEILKRFKELEAMVNALQKTPLPTPVHESATWDAIREAIMDPSHPAVRTPEPFREWTNDDLHAHVQKLVGFKFSDFMRLGVPTPLHEIVRYEGWDDVITPDVRIVRGNDSYTMDWKMSDTRQGYVARLEYDFGLLNLHKTIHGWTITMYQDHFFLSQDEAYTFAKEATTPIRLCNFTVNHRTRIHINEIEAMAEMVRIRNEMKGK